MQTTPPITSAETIPAVPDNPTDTIMTDVRIKVISVIPETGFVPTIAIAFAATVVNRNEIIITIKSAINAKPKSFTTPNAKNTYIKTAVIKIPPAINPIGRSLCVLATPSAPLCFPKISFIARLNALFTIFDERIIPIIPAIAIPPIPIGLT